MKSDNIQFVKVAGLTCSGCSSRLSKLLLKHENVTEAKVNHETGEVCIKGTISTNEIKELTNNAGFDFVG